jgi:hypothetical protein
MQVEASNPSDDPAHTPPRRVSGRSESIALPTPCGRRPRRDRSGCGADRRALFVGSVFVAALLACGCQTSSQATKQTRAESIAPAKGDDTAVLASATTGQNGNVVTTANGSSNGGAQTAQTGAKDAGGSRWGSFFGHKDTKDTGDGLVLPRNDEAAENGAADKTAANEF